MGKTIEIKIILPTVLDKKVRYPDEKITTDMATGLWLIKRQRAALAKDVQIETAISGPRETAEMKLNKNGKKRK